MRHQTTHWGTLASLLLALLLAPGSAVSETVPGTANPWLAGMPPGSTDDGNDSVPANSPVLVTTIDVTSIAAFSASVSGGVHFAPGRTVPPNGLCGPTDGSAQVGGHNVGVGGVSNGIANVIAPYGSLISVFLDSTQPWRASRSLLYPSHPA